MFDCYLVVTLPLYYFITTVALFNNCTIVVTTIASVNCQYFILITEVYL